MYSFHLTGSPWFLLLIPVGLWILWRTNAGAAAPGPTGRILFALQAVALILLSLSLTGPELRRHQIRFHNPTVLILRDQSASFRAGATLGLGGRYAGFQSQLASAYGARKFDVRVADFASGGLTSLAAAAEFADTAAIPNLQAVFLFSDGRAVVDSGRTARAWRVPVYPIVSAPDSIAEVQATAVSVDESGVEAKWETVGRLDGEPRLRLLRAGKTVLDRRLPSAGPAPDGSRSFRFAWSPPPGNGALRAILEPAAAGADFDSWNDTVPVAASGSAAARRVFVLKPIRSLDERAMLDALRAQGNLNVTFFPAEGAAALAPTAGDQVWVESGALADGKLAAWLRARAGTVVIYARPDANGSAQKTGPGSRDGTGLPEAPWPEFTPAAEIKVAKMASEAFPDEVVRLKSLSADPLRVPAAPSRGAWVEIREGGKRGMLMGRIELGRGKRALFFSLPAVWKNVFDPQGDFSARENVAAYVRAAYALAGQAGNAGRVSLPHRLIADLPFDADIEMPEAAAGEAAFGVAGPGFAKEWIRSSANGNAEEWTAKEIALPAGRYRAWQRSGSDTLWRDSLAVAPEEALELARLGFDAGSLADLASRSGGAVLRPAGSEVTSQLPVLPAAQIRVDRTVATRLYNTLPLCLLVLAVLALSWTLRKKWDLD